MEISNKIARLEKEIEISGNNGKHAAHIAAIETLLDYLLKNGLLQKSIYYGEELERLYIEANQQEKLGNILNLLGKMYSFIPEMDKSREYLLSALKISRETGDKKCESYSLTNLGLVQRKTDKLDESLDSYFRAKEIMELVLKNPEEKKDHKLISNYLQVLDQIGVLYNSSFADA